MEDKAKDSLVIVWSSGDRDVAEKLTKEWFKAQQCRARFIERI